MTEPVQSRFDQLTRYERTVLVIAATIACEGLETHDSGRSSKARAWLTLRELIAEMEGREPLAIPQPDSTSLEAH
jgi:hypothetical protein